MRTIFVRSGSGPMPSVPNTVKHSMGVWLRGGPRIHMVLGVHTLPDADKEP